MKSLESYIFKRLFLNVTKFAILLIVFVSFLILFKFDNFYLGISRIGNLFSRMYPFDFEILPLVYPPLLDTILISFFSTFLGLVTTIILLPFLTNILYNFKIVPKIFSGVFAIFRTLPSLIIASILVSLFSVGNFSGFISLYIISVLMSAKILKEYAEEVDRKYIDTYTSMGFNKLQIYRLAILENLKTAIFSVFFLVLESNIRGASVLGLVGAGGIGQLLWKELNHLRYDRVGIIILFLILIILIVDMLSLFFRKNVSNKTISPKKYITRKKLWNTTLIFICLSSVYYCYKFLNITTERFLAGATNLKTMFAGLSSPDWSYFAKVSSAMLDSLIIAFYSTFLAAVTAIFLSYFAAKNMSGKYVSFCSKLIVNLLRTFPPIIVAIIFFRGFGPGYISSFFALYIYTLGLITKMYSEVLENIDSNIIMSVDSMGIKKFVGYIKIIFKNSFPEFLSITLYRFEMNIKNSTILGMVGAGGIGQLLINNIEFRNWNRISTILIVLCSVIILIENISYFIREKIKQ